MMAARHLKNLDWHRRRSFVSLYVNSITTILLGFYTTTIRLSSGRLSLLHIRSLFFFFTIFLSYFLLISFSFLLSSLFCTHTHTHNIETRDLSFFCFFFLLFPGSRQRETCIETDSNVDASCIPIGYRRLPLYDDG